MATDERGSGRARAKARAGSIQRGRGDDEKGAGQRCGGWGKGAPADFNNLEKVPTLHQPDCTKSARVPVRCVKRFEKVSRPLYRWKRLEKGFIMVPIPSQVAEIENLDPKLLLLPKTKIFLLACKLASIV